MVGFVGKCLTGILVTWTWLIMTSALKDLQPIPQTPVDFKNRLKQTSYYLKNTDPYDKISTVALLYVRHFMEYQKMTMLTKSGYITVPISEGISANLTKMAYLSIHLENFRNAILSRNYDLNNPIDAFKFVRNNTLQLDRIVRHLNDSFIRHGDLEHPQQLRFYHKFRAHDNMIAKEAVISIMKVLTDILATGNFSYEDIANGRFVHQDFDRLSTGDCIELGDLFRRENVAYSALFYRAAIERLPLEPTGYADAADLNDKLIDLYTPYGCKCKKQYRKVKQRLDEAIEFVKQQDEAEDEEDAENARKLGLLKENSEENSENEAGNSENEAENSGNEAENSENEAENSGNEADDNNDKKANEPKDKNNTNGEKLAKGGNYAKGVKETKGEKSKSDSKEPKAAESIETMDCADNDDDDDDDDDFSCIAHLVSVSEINKNVKVEGHEEL